ncbi:MAG TPA: cysteine-rich CWC family protein [Ramlibacter sp.]|nr:cysteine-rich CWC family protein [Ramlibacter sp.]
MTIPADRALDAGACPLCGQANACAMELQRTTGVDQPPCWCTQLDFTTELLARVPAQARNRACICPACARGLASA